VLHEKIVNQRINHIHQSTSRLTSDNQAVGTLFVEDLNVAGMVKNRKLSRQLMDASFGKFFEVLQYKCRWKGIRLLKIGRFEPSSKTCGHCGQINKELSLSDREWICTGCGYFHDRDLNAAQNIRRFGLKKYFKDKDTGGYPGSDCGESLIGEFDEAVRYAV